MESDRLAAETEVAGYVGHVPLYPSRSAGTGRVPGLAMRRAAPNGRLPRVGELLAPTDAAMRQELVARSYYPGGGNFGRCTNARWRRLQRAGLTLPGEWPARAGGFRLTARPQP